MTNYTKDEPIEITIDTESGGPIVKNVWKIDGDIVPNNNTNILSILPNTLEVGVHNISFIGTNYCGNCSDEKTTVLNITEANNITYTQEDTIKIVGDSTITIKLRRSATLTVMVVDEEGVPVHNAFVEIVGTEIKGTTDITGKVVLSNVKLGDVVLKTTISGE